MYIELKEMPTKKNIFSIFTHFSKPLALLWNVKYSGVADTRNNTIVVNIGQ